MKKILATALSALLLFAAPIGSAAYFSDTNEHWAESDIDTLQAIGIMQGDGNSAFPEKRITRAEITTLIARAFLKLDDRSAKQYFADVPQDSVFLPYINTAYEKGIVNGAGEDRFLPNSYVTREEIVLMLSRIDTIPNKTAAVSFADISKNYKYTAELKKVIGNEIVLGFDDGRFYPHNSTTRAQAAAMIVRAMHCAKPQKSIIEADIEKIVYANFTDLEYLSQNAIGNAYSDIMYRLSFQTNDVTAEITNPKQISHSSGGMFRDVEYSCTASFQNENYSRTLSAAVVCNFVTLNDEEKLYNISTRLYESEPINLAWDISAQTLAYIPNGLTHISPSAYVISDENQYGDQINLNSSKLKLYNRMNDKYINAAHDAEIGVWAVYKTDFKAATANSFLHDSASMTAAIEYLRGECMRTGIDGINLDFENMYQSDSAAYADHVKKLTLALHDIGVIVSADITRYEKTSAAWSMCYDRDKLALFADYIMIMAYDQYYAGSKVAGPVASLPWTEDTVRLTLNEVPNDRLILGIPFYVRYWESANGAVTSTKAISMQSARELADKNNAAVKYSEKDGLYTAVWYNGGTECKMWLENAQTIFKRKNIAKKYSLSGTAAWRIGLETADVWE